MSFCIQYVYDCRFHFLLVWSRIPVTLSEFAKMEQRECFLHLSRSKRALLALLLSTDVVFWLPTWQGLYLQETRGYDWVIIGTQCPSQCPVLWAFSVGVKELYRRSFPPPHLPLPHDSLLHQHFLFLPIICSNLLAFWLIKVVLL